MLLIKLSSIKSEENVTWRGEVVMPWCSGLLNFIISKVIIQ